MTIPQFEVMTQFYTQEEVETDEFATSLRGVFTKQHDHSLLKSELARFWSTISHVPFSVALVSSDISDPVHRFLHKSLSVTLVGWGTSENKVNHVELFCMMCMIENRPANLASVLAWSMKRTWRGGAGAGIYCGPYVTRIAESLRVFERYPARVMCKGPTSTWVGLKELQGSGIVTLTEPVEWEPIKQGPQVQPPPDTEAAAALQAGVPTRYQRPTHRAELPGRQYPLAQLRPNPLTLEIVYDRIESLRDDIRATMDHLQVHPPPSWQPQLEGQADADARVDPEPPAQIVGESSGAAGQQE
ncbi:hypothetical protein HanPSC8_Chr01g0022701 [Helianthus annuus]|nr:hypothetical protein HanPSC8_Chr01g0022701 [Helianthus annuus]